MLVRAFISVLDELYCGFAVFGVFLRDFSASNRPLRAPHRSC